MDASPTSAYRQRGTYDGSVISRARSVGLGAIQLVDFNGDGYPDILLRAQDIGTDLIASTTTSLLWLNDGAGKFTPWHLQHNGVAVSSKVLEESLPQWGNYLALVMDANRDGRLDLVLLRQMGSDQPEPIPQTKTVAISILLRAPDAPPVSDPNFQGLWWNPDQSGWGINFAHQGDIIFATWFTYDAAGKPSSVSSPSSQDRRGHLLRQRLDGLGSDWSGAEHWTRDLSRRCPSRCPRRSCEARR